MLSTLARVLLTMTSMAPVGLVYAWAAYTQNSSDVAILIAVASALLVPVCIAIMRFAKYKLESFHITIEAIEPADRENTSFLLLYLLPLFTDKFDTLNWSVWVPILAIFALMTSSGYNYHFNPLLSLFGWHFYRVESDGVSYVLITRRHLRSVVGRTMVCQLTEYILLENKVV